MSTDSTVSEGMSPAAHQGLGPLVTHDDYDWADQRNNRRRRENESLSKEEAAAAAASDVPRLDRLNVMRESSVHNKGMLDGGVRQLCARNAQAPGIEKIRAAGLDPLYEPDACAFEVVPLTGDKYSAAFFTIGNVGWLYSPASAKKSNVRGDNEFTAALIGLIIRYRPHVLDAVSFTRLVRSLDHGARLGAACGEFVDIVEAGEWRLDFQTMSRISAISVPRRSEHQRVRAGRRGAISWPQPS